MPDSQTPIQINYPVPEDFVILAKKWSPDAIDTLLGYVWQGYDLLKTKSFDVSKDDDHLEDEITYALYCKIGDASQFSSFQVILHPTEREQKKTLGSLPTSDLGFRLIDGNVRSHFTIEAKVIRTEGSVSEYVKEINNNLLPGRYSMFSSEAAMLGYLLSGNPVNTFQAISTSLNCKLHQHQPFKKRNHHFSNHTRQLSNKNNIPPAFRCHHLVLNFLTQIKVGEIVNT